MFPKKTVQIKALISRCFNFSGHKIHQLSYYNDNNNLLLGSSITESGLHRGPTIIYNDEVKDRVPWILNKRSFRLNFLCLGY